MIPMERKKRTRQRSKKMAKTVPCPGCPKIYTEEEWNRHVITHYPGCMYECAWPGCKQCCAQLSNLGTHIDTHAGVRRKYCRVCDTWNDPARSSRSRHKCKKRAREDDDESPTAKKHKGADAQEEDATRFEALGHASSSHLNNPPAVPDPYAGPIAGPSRASYTDYSHDIASAADDAGAMADLLQESDDWLPQPYFALDDFRDSTVTPVPLDSSVIAQANSQHANSHSSGGLRYYNEPSSSIHGGVAQLAQLPCLPDHGFDLCGSSSDFNLANPELYDPAAFDLAHFGPATLDPAAFEPAVQPQFAPQPELTVLPQPSAQTQATAQRGDEQYAQPLWLDEQYAQPQLPWLDEQYAQPQLPWLDEQYAHPQPLIAPGPDLELQHDQLPLLPSRSLAGDNYPLGSFTQDVLPADFGLASNLPNAPPLDVAPAAAGYPSSALNLASLPVPVPEYVPAYMRTDVPLPDWFQASLQDEMALLMNGPAVPELPAYAPTPEINIDFCAGAGLGVGDNWEQAQRAQWDLATMAGGLALPAPEPPLPEAQDFFGEPWLVNPRPGPA